MKTDGHLRRKLLLKQGFTEVKKTEPHEAEGLLFVGDCLVVPQEMRHKFLTQIYLTHQGINPCQNKSRL